MTLFINNDTTIDGVCQTLTLMLDTSNSGYVYKLTLTYCLLIVKMGGISSNK